MPFTPFENPLSALKQQSTIYRRHERRRMKTYPLREDPRIAPIRVLSGLPGFRTFVKPFNPNQSNKILSANQKPSPFDHNEINEKKSSFNDQNFFILNDMHSANHSPQQKHLEFSPFNLNAIFFSGCIGGAMEALLGRSSTDVLSRASRQVALVAGNVNHHLSNRHVRSTHLLFQSNTNIVALPSTFANPSASLNQTSLPKPNILINERIIASAFAAGLLFSSNAFFRSILCNDDKSSLSNIQSGSYPLSSSFIIASAATGFVTGTTFAPFELIRSRLLMQYASTKLSRSPFLRNSSMSPLLSSKYFISEMSSVLQRHGFQALFKGGSEVYSREMLGNVVYFSTYELMKSYLMQSTNGTKLEQNQPSALQILMSGASAGVAYWAAIYPIDTLKAMLQAQSISNPRFHTAISAINEIGLKNLYRGYFSCVVRAAPANAMLCFGYEIALSLFSKKDM